MNPKLRSLLASAVLLTAGFSVGAILPQDAARNAAAPSPEVKRLLAMEGLWETKLEMGGLPPSPGLAKLSIIGGHWLIEEFSGEFGGQPFAGHGITGYDVKRKTYVNAWADSMDTGLKVVDLRWDDELAGLVSEMPGIDMGSGPQTMRGVTRMPDANTMIFTMTPVAPDSQPAMTITYTRSR